MKKSLFSQVKNSKLFYLKDLFAYAFAVLLIVVLAIFFLIIPNGNSKGFKVELDGKTVLTYSFSESDYEICDEFESSVLTKTVEGGIVFTVYNESGFNEIFIDLINKTAKVIDSDCSISKDCAHSPQIKDSGAIICAPHKLKLSPLSDSGVKEPIAG